MRFHEVFSFSKREEIDDGAGNTLGQRVEQFKTRAAITYKDGNEAVIAARLEGKQPAFLIIRRSVAAGNITTDWMCQNTRTGERFNIRSISIDTNNRQYYRLTIEGGVAEG